jgi:microcin C transport system substrate-binding protein
MRSNLRQAMALLKDAGYTQKNGVLIDANGKPFKFEILMNTSMFSRWILPFIANLKRLGIEANLREVDEAQYQNRMNDFDFDMTVDVFGQSINPGNEQRNYWGSQMADEAGSANKMGIKSPVVDKLIDHIVQAQSRESLVAATRALDRVLLWNFYVIPQWYSGTFRLVYNTKLGHSATIPPFGLPIEDTWWVKP